MAMVEQHMKDCERLLGRSYKDVHLWLDGMARYFPFVVFSDYHRTFRHNSFGVAYVTGKWGIRAGRAAKLHLLRDYDDRLLMNKDVDKLLDRWYNKVVMWFNDPENMELMMTPSVMRGWEGKSLVRIALEEW